MCVCVCVCVCVYMYIYTHTIVVDFYNVFKDDQLHWFRMLLSSSQFVTSILLWYQRTKGRYHVVQKLSVRDSDCGALEDTCRRRSGMIHSLSRATFRVHEQAITRLRSAAFICALKVTQKDDSNTQRGSETSVYWGYVSYSPWRICVSVILVLLLFSHDMKDVFLYA